MRAACALPYDPRFNAIHWMLDCWHLSYQIEYSWHQVDDVARAYRCSNRPGQNPSDAIPKLGYYADNAVIRLMSFADKLGLCLYSYYEDFNPNGNDVLLSLKGIVGSLENGSTLRNRGADKAAAILRPLLQKRPRVLKLYRDSKVHR